MKYHTLTLMANGDMSDLIVYSIGLVIVVGGWVAGQLKRMREKPSAAPKPSEEAPSQPSLGPQRLEDLAAKRRMELQKMVQQRRAQRGARPAAEARPENLKLGQLEQREQARLQYQSRADALEREREVQRGKPQPQRSSTSPSAPAQPSGPPRRPRWPRLRAGRPRPALQPRQGAHRPPSPTSQRRQQPVSPPLDEGVVEIVELESTGVQTEMRVKRRVSDVIDTPKSRKVLTLRGSSIRDAFILKEILDRPLSLRASPDSSLELL